MLSTKIKRSFLAIPLVALAACEEPGAMTDTSVVADSTPAAEVVTPTAGPAPEVAQAAQVLATALNSLSQRNLGGDIIIQEARANGGKIEVDLRVVTTRVRYDARLARQQLRRAACGTETISAFLLIGGEIQYNVLSRSNSRLGSVTISSC